MHSHHDTLHTELVLALRTRVSITPFKGLVAYAALFLLAHVVFLSQINAYVITLLLFSLLMSPTVEPLLVLILALFAVFQSELTHG